MWLSHAVLATYRLYEHPHEPLCHWPVPMLVLFPKKCTVYWNFADIQAAEIAAAEKELHTWQQRCFPCLPALAGDDDQQPSGGADQAPGGLRAGGSGSCILPEIKGAQGSPGDAAAQSLGGFAPHGARAAVARGHGALAGSGQQAGGLGVKKGGKTYIGPDGKPGLLRRG